MAGVAIIQSRNAAWRRLLDLQVAALEKDLHSRLAEAEKQQRNILRCLFPGKVFCKQCMSKVSERLRSNKMEHKKHGIRVHSSLEDNGTVDKKLHPIRPERSYSDNNLRMNHADHTPTTNCVHTALADLKASSGYKRSLHGMSNSASASVDLTPHQLHNGTHASSKLRHSEILRQSSAKSVDAVDVTASDTNLTAFLFSRHCRHGYVMKKAADPTEQTKNDLKSKIRAKVVKNYLLQDVFKRLNTTKSLVVKNTASGGSAGSPAGLTQETIQTLEQCRYLRLPMKTTIQGLEDEDEKQDDKLPKVDVK